MSWTALEAGLGVRVLEARALHGGDLSEVFGLSLSDGRRTAAKRGTHVATEAGMLRAMRDAGAPVPEVLWVGDGQMALEWLEERAATEAGWAALGRWLRRLHDTRGDRFGWPEDYAFGPVALDNAARADWPTFWGKARLAPFLPRLDTALARQLERLIAALPERLGDVPPALLHGDLWTGNALFAGDTAWMIDPACYYGDPEVDLAMLEVFGRPPPAFWESYGALRDGRLARRPVYQLFPALVHLRLFGAGYRGMVEGLLSEAGA